ncbi:MAG: Fe-S cluster assembly ATPase SufC [Fimbriimonadia bacterium]|jgi:Fe-S cluster assembly ATP-binding protein
MSENDYPLLEVRELSAGVEGKTILNGVSLTLRKGEVHAIMGPNGSGKSTLSNVLMGHPGYEVLSGEVLYKGQDLLAMETDERAKAGVFLAFQYPTAIPGVTAVNFLRTALKSLRGQDMPARDFRKMLKEKLSDLSMDESFATRYVNDGFSGGEKKRFEMLQMAMIQPELAIMDETDSGLDIDALRVVSENVNRMRGPDLGVLLITHYSRILTHITPDFVHVMANGRIIKSGGKDLAHELEERGYDWLLNGERKEAEVSASV